MTTKILALLMQRSFTDEKGTEEEVGSTGFLMLLMMRRKRLRSFRLPIVERSTVREFYKLRVEWMRTAHSGFALTLMGRE